MKYASKDHGGYPTRERESRNDHDAYLRPLIPLQSEIKILKYPLYRLQNIVQDIDQVSAAVYASDRLQN